MDEFTRANVHLDAGDGEKALAMFRPLAEGGRVDAMHSIAHTYLYGIAGVERDYDQAFSWFTRAADNGCPQAMYHLGMCNANGFGTPVNQEAATRWYRASAEQGDEDAMYELAKRLEEGVGTTADTSKAFAWYERARARGQKQASERLRTDAEKR